MKLPTVSVVIPTVDRPAARAAVMSALNQTHPPIEVIVAVDRADGIVPPSLSDLRDKITVVFSGGIGPSGARMLAYAEASGDAVAFLDDDDTWFPEKLERQLALWPGANSQQHALVSSRTVEVATGGETLRVVPARLISPGERVATYLFRRTRIAYDEGALHPSTLVCNRELLAVEPWDASVRLHEDWDWVLRVGARDDARIIMSPDILVSVATGDRQSLSRSADWKPSFTWLRQRAGQFNRRELGDFALCYTAVLAIRSGNRRASLAAARYALANGSPGPHSWLVWLLNLISPSLVDRGSSMLARAGRKNTESLWTDACF